MVRKTPARKTTATASKAVTRSKASVAAPAAKKSSEIKPRRALTATAQKLKSPKVLVPLTVAVGVGVAAIAKLVKSSNGKSAAALPRLAKDLSPRFAEAVKALGDLGRELRAKVR